MAEAGSGPWGKDGLGLKLGQNWELGLYLGLRFGAVAKTGAEPGAEYVSGARSWG